MTARRPYPGFFLTLEGTEGSGKTTAADELQRRLVAAGRRVVRVREPGGTAMGEAVREVLFRFHGMGARSELLLFLASRAELSDTVIRPALEAGDVVLCDRFMDSTLVYQSMLGGLPFGEVLEINDFSTGGLLPDLTLVFLTDYLTARARMDARGGGGKYDDLDEEGFWAVHDGYRTLADAYPWRLSVVDAAGPPEAVAEAAWQRLPEEFRG